MNLHEYQTKRLFAAYGIPVPLGGVASSAEDAVAVAGELPGNAWVVKAQVHAGGRGKAGGIQRVEGLDALRDSVEALIGRRLVTAQTGAAGLLVREVLIESVFDAAQELYLSIAIDRMRQCPVILVSRRGGVDIEALARSHPQDLIRRSVDVAAGLYPFQCRCLAFELGLAHELVSPFVDVLQKLYRVFMDKDALLLEINPLAIAGDGVMTALDAKIVIDDNALFRQQALAQWRDTEQEHDKEAAARELGLNYVSVDGNIGCMVNGAGLAMATMDLIKLHGGRPANFLDVGGSATADVVAEAFTLIQSDPKVAAILVNIFGGIVRCDLIAAGIIKAVEGVEVKVPVVVRLEGTNAEAGRHLLRESGMNIIAADGLAKAAELAVAAAGSR